MSYPIIVHIEGQEDQTFKSSREVAKQFHLIPSTVWIHSQTRKPFKKQMGDLPTGSWLSQGEKTSHVTHHNHRCAVCQKEMEYTWVKKHVTTKVHLNNIAKHPEITETDPVLIESNPPPRGS